MTCRFDHIMSKSSFNWVAIDASVRVACFLVVPAVIFIIILLKSTPTYAQAKFKNKEQIYWEKHLSLEGPRLYLKTISEMENKIKDRCGCTLDDSGLNCGFANVKYTCDGEFGNFLHVTSKALPMTDESVGDLLEEVGRKIRENYESQEHFCEMYDLRCYQLPGASAAYAR